MTEEGHNKHAQDARNQNEQQQTGKKTQFHKTILNIFEDANLAIVINYMKLLVIMAISIKTLIRFFWMYVSNSLRFVNCSDPRSQISHGGTAPSFFPNRDAISPSVFGFASFGTEESALRNSRFQIFSARVHAKVVRAPA